MTKPKFDQDFWEQLWTKTKGGALFLVGHRPIDPGTGAATAAASQVQVSVEDAVAALALGHH